jgi:hypothetical protein
MASDTKWFLVKSERPHNAKTGAPFKSKAPYGLRPLLVDDRAKKELIAVEGEGHAVALLSIGATGVLCGGGVNNFWARGTAAAVDRAAVYEGKSVRFLLDPDPAGRAAVIKAARQALDSGALRVAIVDLPTEGQDVEDWLATFATPDAAQAALFQLLGTSDWEGAEELDKREKDAAEDVMAFVQSRRIWQQGDDEPTLIMMVYDEKTRRTALSVYGPLEDVTPELAKYGDTDIDRTHRGWRTMDSWSYDGTTFLPDVEGATLQYLEERTLILPQSPPDKPMSSKQLWIAVRDFIQTWVHLDESVYDCLVAYVLMSYRLEDAGFHHVPYLRFYGPPGTGKGRGLEVMSSLCSRSFVSQPTVSNIHRVVEYFGFITMVFDEFHLDRGMSRESQQKMVDTLCLGYRRGMGVIRVVDAPGGRKVIQQFPLFGCKIFAGYGHDEDESLARRTVNIKMSDITVPESMDLMCLPARFYEDAAVLRGELLAFRGRALSRGLPDPEGPRAIRLRREAGTFVGQVFFPLVSMVPDGMTLELNNLMAVASQRRADAKKTRETSEESYLIDALCSVIDDGEAHIIDDGKDLFITTEHLHDKALERTGLPLNTVPRRLQSLGLKHSRRRVPSRSSGKTAPRGGFAIAENDAILRDLTERYGIQWPRTAQKSQNITSVTAPGPGL